jgi:hypothetical protein
MSSANDPSASTHTTSPDTGRTSLQAVPPPPETPASPAKEKRKRLTIESLQRIVSRLDKLTVGIVLLLTFLLASFAARNSDLWMHLASGRAMVQQHSLLKEDPFSFTASGPWVNHSWLGDLALYGVFQLTGGTDLENPNLSVAGPVLIGIKAIFMVILAGILMCIRRTGQSVWLAAVFTALAMVVLSRWIFLQPKCISLLFLGLTLCLLQRPSSQTSERKLSLGHPMVAIPLLFVLWVNLDEWFVLGPITVALFLIGELAQQFLMPLRTGEDAPAPGRSSRLASLLAVALLACLLNPHFYHAFRIPTDVWPWLTDSPLQRDDTYVQLFQSPLSQDEIRTAFSANPSSADIAYYLLAGLGLVSFVLNWAGWRGWRMMIWLGFFVMSAALMRTIPFFAVVAGPITALNFQDFAARRYGLGLKLENPWRTISIGGRLLTVTAGILLLVAAWPGLLHAKPDNALATHHVSWQIEMNSSLHNATLRLRELRQAGVLGEGNGFNFSPEIANYCAWFCPEERSFFDARFPLFDKVAEAYIDVRTALSPSRESVQSLSELQQRERERASKLLEHLRTHQINHLMVTGSSYSAIQPAVLRIWQDPRHWTPVYMDGRTAIFCWTPPSRNPEANRFAAYAFQPEPLAFAPSPPAEARAPSQAPTAAESRTTWNELWRGPAPRSINTDLSTMLVPYSQTLNFQGQYYFMVDRAAWQIMSLSGPVATSPAGNYLIQSGTAMRFAAFSANNLLLDLDPRSGPWAAALLAVRAGRRAIADNAQDADSFLALADAVQYLSQQFERNSVGQPLTRIRQIQQAAALRRALALKPDRPDIHERLATLYFQMRIFDLSSEHNHKALDLITAAGPRPKESEEDFKKRIDRKKSEVKTLDEQSRLERLKSEYQLAVRQSSLRGRRASEAARRGLYQEALNLLIDNEEAVELEPNEARLALDLLISTGRLDEARGQSQDIQDVQLRYEIAAGLGDYAQADEALAKLIQDREKADVDRVLFLLRNSTWARSFGPNGQIMGMGPEFLMGLQSSAAMARNWADLWAVRGVLALEAGDPLKAEQDFQHALEWNRSGQALAVSTIIVQVLASKVPLEAATYVGAKYAGGPVPFSFSEQPLVLSYLNMLQNAKQPTPQKSNSSKPEREALAP